ncbi:MAG: DNA replication protein [Alphaproteobacteria bacterium]|nr:DNA replication protein [Alphaproteobacteria bacterium]
MTTPVSQLVMPFTGAVSYAAEDYIVGDANRHAVEVLDQFPNWPEPVMALYGPPASGKTHLAQRMVQKHGGFYVTQELGTVDAATLAARAPLLVVDGWNDEAALAQLINHCRAQNHALLVTMPEAPARLKVRLPDLHSRLSAMVALELTAPNESLLGALLSKHFADRQIRVAPEVITYIVARMERSYASAHHAAAWLDSKALESGRAITLPLAREWVSHAV